MVNGQRLQIPAETGPRSCHAVAVGPDLVPSILEGSADPAAFLY